MYYRDYSVDKYEKGGMMAKGGTTKAKGGKFGINDMVMVDDSGYIKLFTGFDTTKPAKIIDVNKVKTSRGTLYTYGLEFDGGKKPFNYAMENKLSLVNSGMMAKGGKMTNSGISADIGRMYKGDRKKIKFIYVIHKRDEYDDIIPKPVKKMSVVRVNQTTAKEVVYKKYPSKDYFVELENAFYV